MHSWKTHHLITSVGVTAFWAPEKETVWTWRISQTCEWNHNSRGVFHEEQHLRNISLALCGFFKIAELLWESHLWHPCLRTHQEYFLLSWVSGFCWAQKRWSLVSQSIRRNRRKDQPLLDVQYWRLWMGLGCGEGSSSSSYWPSGPGWNTYIRVSTCDIIAEPWRGCSRRGAVRVHDVTDFRGTGSLCSEEPHALPPPAAACSEKD